MAKRDFWGYGAPGHKGGAAAGSPERTFLSTPAARPEITAYSDMLDRRMLLMPRLASTKDFVEHDILGYALSNVAGDQAIASAWMHVNAPRLAGYRRQFRARAQVYYTGVAGVTAHIVYIRTNGSGFPDYPASAHPTAGLTGNLELQLTSEDVQKNGTGGAGGWYEDTRPDLDEWWCFLQSAVGWTGAVGQDYLRAFFLYVRYIREGEPNPTTPDGANPI